MTDHERGIAAAMEAGTPKGIRDRRSHRERVEDSIAAYLSATASNPVLAEAWKVKPLDWSAEETGTPRTEDAFGRQYCVYSEFSLAGQPSDWSLSIDCRPFNGIFSSEEKAKAAAQADYEQRIMSALSALAPQAGDKAEEPVAWESAPTEELDYQNLEGKTVSVPIKLLVDIWCEQYYGVGGEFGISEEIAQWNLNQVVDLLASVGSLPVPVPSHPCTSTPVVSQNAPALEDKGGDGWQPIGTCPKNRSVIMQCMWKHQLTAPYIFEGYLDWDGVTWRYQDGKPLKDEITPPVCWRPMPTPALSTAPEAK